MPTPAPLKNNSPKRKTPCATSLKQSEIQAALSRTGQDRINEINKLAAPGTKRNEILVKLAAAHDALVAATAEEKKYDPAKAPPTSVLAALTSAQADYDAATAELDATNVDMPKLLNLLNAANDPKNTVAKTELAALPSKYPTQAAQISRVINAHAALAELGGGSNDATELQRLVTAAGVLDFRITVAPKDLSPQALQDAMDSLQAKGPQAPIAVNGTKAQWFQIEPDAIDNFRSDPKSPTYITADWGGQKYILMYDDVAHTLTHDLAMRSREWSIRAREVYSDTDGIKLPFDMDSVGAGYLGELTKDNMHQPMGILLDDKAFTAPNINARIEDSGVITFGVASGSRTNEMIKKEADGLKQIMDSGSLPATLQREPISVVEITPDLGADNISAGLHSAVYAMIAVVAFMMLYYTITGVFANLALMVNLLLVLGTMALLGGTFTLPGIAGLVLTLGMAVDANVLINERIREELHKGASLWMAVKQGYDKVFWTIFDANLTTSLTSIVLIYVGSEEVKGFGITLLIGLIIHMFTALFATRTLMMAAIKWGVIRAIDDHSISEYLREIFTFTWLRNGHWPFMRVITVTNIDWIGKRYIFWGISAAITVAGLVAFVARGEDKYDIEFRGGTQVTFQLKPGADLSLEQVRARVKHVANIPGLQDVADARVYGVGKPEEHRFELQTTIAGVPGKDQFLSALAKELGDVLDLTPKVRIDGIEVESRQINDLINQRKIIAPITRGTLDQVFADVGVQGMPNRDLTDFANGVAIVLNNINPPQKAEKLVDRIKSAEQGSDPALANVSAREFKILPLEAVPDAPGAATQGTTTASVPASEDDKRPLTRAVLVAVDPNERYTESTKDHWAAIVAAPEWKIVQAALATESLFRGVTSFDAVVASQAKMQALTAIILSLILIVAYVWVRFGGIRYGIGAILSLVHDAVVALAATVLSGIAYRYFFGSHGNWLLISDFKINLTMIAAYLTVIGYSVNDTIVIFDRVRELRGRNQSPLTAQLVNDAINQCFGRTIWTTFTVFIVVLIMYIWGGEGIRGFSFAMLIGVFTGAYSTLAIASPMLLTTGAKMEHSGGAGGLAKRNPFLKAQPDLPEPIV